MKIYKVTKNGYKEFGEIKDVLNKKDFFRADSKIWVKQNKKVGIYMDGEDKLNTFSIEECLYMTSGALEDYLLDVKIETNGYSFLRNIKGQIYFDVHSKEKIHDILDSFASSERLPLINNLICTGSAVGTYVLIHSSKKWRDHNNYDRVSFIRVVSSDLLETYNKKQDALRKSSSSSDGYDILDDFDSPSRNGGGWPSKTGNPSGKGRRNN